MSGFPDNVQRGTSFIWVALHVGLLGGSPLAPSTHTFCRSEETFEQGLWKTPEIEAAWFTPLRFVWPQKSCLWIWGSWALEVASCSQHHTAILRSNGRAVRWWTWSGDSDIRKYGWCRICPREPGTSFGIYPMVVSTSLDLEEPYGLRWVRSSAVPRSQPPQSEA